MFSDFYRLKTNPFSETPDVEFFFTTCGHELALTRLVNAIESGVGFSLLTGSIGVGKTLVSRCLIRVVQQSQGKTAYVLQPQGTADELLAYILKDFGLAIPKSQTRSAMLERLNKFLMANAGKGVHSLLVIDEAQHLTNECLELVRLLNNLELNDSKLLHIALVGQMELKDKLKQYELRQLNQRISIRVTLSDIEDREVGPYIQHRIEKVGGANFIAIRPDAVRLISVFSQNVPRLINIFMSSVIAYGEANGLRVIDASAVKKALFETGHVGRIETLFPLFTKLKAEG